MSEEFLQKNGLELQIALLACQAIESGDPISFLNKQLPYQNLAEYHLQETGPLRYLLLLSDSRALYALTSKGSAAAASTSLQSKPQPTAYFAIDNRVTDATPGLPSVSFANFCSALAPCKFELSEGAHVQSLVVSALEGLPLFTLLNLLGQGYKIVFAGRQFGGVVAHALASKLLLQVQFEIQTAQKMGIDLSALSRTGDKVVSFALSSPLFANAALQEALATHGLSNNLHTLWRPRDASNAFLTLCGNLFSSAGQGAPEGKAGAVSRSGVLAHANTPQFKALQRWTAVLQEELAKTSRKVDQAFAASPVDLSSDASKAAAAAAAAQGSRAEAGANGEASAGQQRPKALVIGATTKPNTGAPNSPTGRPAQLKAAVASSAARPAARASDNGARLSGSGARVSGSGVAAPRRSPVATSPRGAPAAVVKETPPPPPPEPISVSSVWKASVQELQAMGSGEGAGLHAVGRFWLVDGAAASDAACCNSPKHKPASLAASSSVKGAAVFSFNELAPGKAGPTSLSWLAPSNKDMFTRWECSLEEMKRDLLEIYAWTTFKTTVEVNGAPVDRKEALRPTRMQIQ